MTRNTRAGLLACACLTAMLLQNVEAMMVQKEFYYGTVAADIYYNITCPPTGTYNVTMPGVGVALSSNFTLKPFASAPVPVTSIYPVAKQPLGKKVCDKFKRCIVAYELVAKPIVIDFGFRGPKGEKLLSDYLGYDGLVPGPTITVDQGTQSLVRLVNQINCPNASAKTPEYFSYNNGLTMHLHGAAAVAPFDGWTNDLIPACGFKDYVYPNDKPQLLWYHDHTNNFTENNVEFGLAGGYYVRSCNMDLLPKQLRDLGDAQYMFLQDRVFNWTGDKMQPVATYGIPGNTLNQHYAFGDHNMINGVIWPNVQVERRAYRWIFLNGASYRTFTLMLQDALGDNLMATGLFYIVGGDGGLRQVPVQAQSGLIISPGERYEVVIDFSAFLPGTVLYLENVRSASSPLPNPYFCYTNRVMRFTVVESFANASSSSSPSSTSSSSTSASSKGAKKSVQKQKAEAQPPFSPFYNLGELGYRALGPEFRGNQLQKYCQKAMAGNADRKIQTQADPAVAFQFVGNVGDSGSNAPGANEYVASFIPATYTFLPTSAAVNSWETWEVYNNATQSADFLGNMTHPIHVHLIDLMICGRENRVLQQTTGIRDYELFMPKDTFVLAPYDRVWMVARFGPHQGSYMWHCHNLGHEDFGLMAAINVSDPFKPPRTKTAFGPYAKDPDRYVEGWKDQPVTPAIYEGEDPLVVSVKGTYIGKDLYFPDSMPPFAMRRDPKDPSKPQPITKQLLAKVLEREYYKVFYPKRKDLSVTVKHNKWAVTCNAKSLRDATSRRRQFF